MSEVVGLSVEEGIAEICLRRLPNNPINQNLLRELNTALSTANEDDSVGVILVYSSGSSFSVGDDMADHIAPIDDPDHAHAFVAAIQDVTRSIMFNKKPVVTAVNGWAVGGALSWALNSDFSIWADTAKGFFPEASYGIFLTGAASFLLPLRVGHARALEICLLGRRYSASEFHGMKLNWQVTASSDLLTIARGLAGQLAAVPAQSLASFKQEIVAPFRSDIESALENEATLCLQASKSPEVVASMRSVAEKVVAARSERARKAEILK